MSMECQERDLFSKSFDSELSTSQDNDEMEEHGNHNHNSLNDKQYISLILSISKVLGKVTDLEKEPSLALNSPFTSVIIPVITIEDYLKRIIQYTYIEQSTLILSLVYIDKVSQRIKVNWHNIHKLLICSILLAIKYNEDCNYSDKYYSKVGGVTLSEMREMEYQFLSFVEFNLYVEEDLFKKYERGLMKCCF